MLRSNMHRSNGETGTRIAAVVLVVCALFVVVAAAKDFVMPKAFHAKTYPAHDEHPAEKVSIAVDPYDMADKAAVFSVPYAQHGFLPFHVIISNDGDSAAFIANMKLELITRDRTKIQPADDDDIFRRISRLKRRGDEPSRNPLPIPLPRSKDRGGVPKQAYEELEASKFRAKAVEPHSTQAGFFFFDVGDLRDPLAGAHLYVTGLSDGNGGELMYFEIPLEKYLSYQPAK
ncbi:MAG TPA: hypothetical protein VN622_00110 [Clostridia bacterium]|nr:hypothetical protein [Clostridia bacterium]